MNQEINNPNPDDKKQQELQIFVEYLKRGTLLLDLKELDAFHFQIDQNDPNAQELANIINTQGVTPENYESTIRPKALIVMDYLFTQEKIQEIHGILGSLESLYSDNDEVCKISLASKLFLEDPNAKHKFLPIAVARLLEDIYATYYIPQDQQPPGM